MTNNYNIPDWLEKKVKIRDQFCVYCQVKLKEYPHTKGTPSDKATFEHIDNDGPPSEENIALCCASCNSSKGVKKLKDWLNSPYCRDKNINIKNVAAIIRLYLESKK
jgi:hypothetical protein